MPLIGKRIKLIPVRKKHADILLKWRNASHVTRNSFNRRRIGKTEHMKWLASLLKDKNRVTFLIVLNKENKPLGKIGLKNIDFFNKRAELEKMIGDEDFQGRGYATEAATLFLKYAFKKFSLIRIYAHVFESNVANIKVNKLLGFKIEGIMRKHAFNNGRFINILYMGLLKEEFTDKRIDT